MIQGDIERLTRLTHKVEHQPHGWDRAEHPSWINDGWRSSMWYAGLHVSPDATSHFVYTPQSCSV